MADLPRLTGTQGFETGTTRSVEVDKQEFLVAVEDGAAWVEAEKPPVTTETDWRS